MKTKGILKFMLPVVTAVLSSSLPLQTARGAALSASFYGLPPGSGEDLTADGALDWAHWGLTTTNSFDHKSGVTPLIGNYTVMGVNPVQQTNDVGVGYSWSDGTPTALVANSTTALLVTGTDNGFQFQVTADTNLTRLLVFVGTRAAEGKLQLHLSDSSVADYADTSLDIISGETNGVYTIDFASATSGQTLTVTFTLQSPHAAAGAVLLHAAAVQFGPFNFEPFITLTYPTNISVFAWPATINLTADADDFDGSTREVQFFANDVLVGTTTNAPYEYAWSGAAPGLYSIMAVATDNLGASAVSDSATVFIYTNTGVLMASAAASTSTVDLSAEGTSDWAHWGLLRESSYDHKFGIVPQISNYTGIDYSPAFWLPNNPVGYSWTNGTPTAAATNTTTGIYFSGVGEGLAFSVPADTSLRTLKLYVGAFAARGKLQLLMSDGSAAPIFDTTVDNPSSGPNSVYTITYRSGAAGQSLNVQFTVDFTYSLYGNVTLQAATLVTDNLPPSCAITNLVDGSIFNSPTNLVLKVSASDNDGSVTNVTFFDGATPLGQVTTAPFELNWPNVPPGAHKLSARASDNLGKTFTSHAVNVFITIGGGTLSGALAVPPSSVGLSSEGRTDWAHWGLLNTNSFNRRASVTQKISSVTKIGDGSFKRLTDYAAGFTWTNGTPTASVAGSTTGIYIEGEDHGFQVTAPADTVLRQLKVFVGVYASRGHFSASLSDASAPDFMDDGVDELYNNAAGVYTLNYAAASSNKTLTVKFTALENYDVDYGNVTFEAVSLALPAVILRDPRHSGSSSSFSFLTDPGVTYTIQRSDILPATNWVTIKTVLGNGSNTNIVDATVGGPQSFYRVLAN